MGEILQSRASLQSVAGYQGSDHTPDLLDNLQEVLPAPLCFNKNMNYDISEAAHSHRLIFISYIHSKTRISCTIVHKYIHVSAYHVKCRMSKKCKDMTEAYTRAKAMSVGDGIPVPSAPTPMLGYAYWVGD